MKKYIWIVAVIAVLTGLYFYFKNTSMPALSATIKNMGGSSSDVSGLGQPFLKAWAKGLKNKSNTFEYAGSTYNSIGGTKVSK